MLNYDYLYLDRCWIFWQVLERFFEPIFRIVSVVYTGLMESLRHVNRTGEFMLLPKQIKVENIWTGYGTGTSISVPVVTSNLSNSYFVAVVVFDGQYALSNVVLRSTGLTSLVGANITVGAYIYGLANPTAGSQNFTATLGSSTTWRVVCYQLSGVNQSTPTVNTNIAVATSGTSASISLTSVANGLLIDALSIANGTGGQGNNGQTVTKVNNIIVSGYKDTSGATETDSYSWTSSQNNRIAGVTFNPA